MPATGLGSSRGTCRLSVRSQRVSDDTATTRTIVPVESNIESFEILPRDPAWVREAILPSE
jgi:hypothetical protein